MGKKEGISGSSYGGINVGINNMISTNRKKLAVDVLTFFTSLKTQKKLMMEGKLFSSIHKLYDDPEVCEVVDCKLFKNIQPIARPSNLTTNYDDYSKRFQTLISEFLYKNRSASEVLTDIDDITRVYFVSVKATSSPLELIIFLITITTLINMLPSFPLLFIKKCKLHFRFLNKDMWMTILLGLIFHLCIIFTHYGKLTWFKCQLKFILISVGLTLTFVPILHRLISNFPYKNKISEEINNQKYLFIFIFIFYDIVINALFLISPYNNTINYLNEGKNFEICKNNNLFGKIIVHLTIFEKASILLSIIFLLFTEWNIWETARDIRLISSAISVDIFLYILYIITNIMNINDFISHFFFSSLILIIFTLSNFIIIYGIKIIRYLTNNDSDIKFSKNIITNINSENSLSKSENKIDIDIQQNVVTSSNIISSPNSNNEKETSSNEFTNTFEIESLSSGNVLAEK